MARYFGRVAGRGETAASRVGNITSGLYVEAMSQGTNITVEYYEQGGEDYVCISVRPNRGAVFIPYKIYEGKVARLVTQQKGLLE